LNGKPVDWMEKVSDEEYLSLKESMNAGSEFVDFLDS
jgi:hypothetical protein